METQDERAALAMLDLAAPASNTAESRRYAELERALADLQKNGVGDRKRQESIRAYDEARQYALSIDMSDATTWSAQELLVAIRRILSGINVTVSAVPARSKHGRWVFLKKLQGTLKK